MQRLRTFILLAGLFASISAIIYLIHYLIFEDIHHIFIYMIGDFAFLPLEVFLVVIVIERILTYREKRAVREKMNMVVGAFFSEIGDHLLRNLLDCFQGRDDIKQNLSVRPDWNHGDFQRAMRFASNLEYLPNCQELNLEELRTQLLEKRQFLVTLLENPNLLEHESFTELLWAVFHLAEELSHRTTVNDLPESDYDHLSGDIRRAHRLLVREWLSHMEHLKIDYPYLFSLAVRTNPFDPNASAQVQ